MHRQLPTHSAKRIINDINNTAKGDNTAEMSKIKIDDVSYIYSPKTPFEITALEHVNAEINDGRITGIIGHTGSGKSTLVQMFNGLVKPTSGKILIDGQDIWESPKGAENICFKVGLVMQYPEYQLFEDTVYKDIAYGPTNMGLDESEIKARVTDAAGFVGLEMSILDKSPFDLSGGQKRRAAIAGVMAMMPEVLVLDEPAAGLDPRGRRVIFDGIRRYSDKCHATVIIVSHSMEDMATYCDDLIVMNHGSIAMSGSKRDVFSQSEKLKAMGLNVPQITELSAELARLGIDIGHDIFTVDEAENAILQLFGGGRK